jgi:hypothetical protein
LPGLCLTPCAPARGLDRRNAMRLGHMGIGDEAMTMHERREADKSKR